MTVDWQVFTPWSALAGGLLIGAAAALLVWSAGRIAGISGILAGFARRDGFSAWRIAFVAGLLAAPWLVGALAPQWPLVGTHWSAADYPRLIVAGLLVGIGTRLANGCTSGHGVCGLARLSLRSLWAVAVFMGTAGLVVFAVRHVPGAGA
ncbi:YeeE/YedE family protein [Pseudothauera rhizosphaerae]|uniref:YeeE/YedE family protein n=1 Tax=Pseudothauera rhizosphaerae TaxID=2565932 RepID=A0A4S4B2S8_9RHOO|nr:YeeE/YedE thiosulfate transporter family protein [Pseudothauera rhizosphaerae]THF65211.1 YeeE/YedE family protein [Pseudothauera rhizosphaerae]